MDHDKYGENGGQRLRRHPAFSGYGYGPSVACTVGCTWLMYSLCMAHIWPMYDLYMAYICQVQEYILNLVITTQGYIHIHMYTHSYGLCMDQWAVARGRSNKKIYTHIYIYIYIYIYENVAMFPYTGHT